QLVEHSQKMRLIRKPMFVLANNRAAIAIRADPERVAPFGATTDVDCCRRHGAVMLVENLAHCLSPDFERPAGGRPRIRGRGSRIADAETACPLTREPPRSDRQGARDQEENDGFAARRAGVERNAVGRAGHVEGWTRTVGNPHGGCSSSVADLSLSRSSVMPC